MNNINLILASTSPRRHELLSKLDIFFEIASVEIDESIIADETPINYISRMTRQKTEAFLKTPFVESMTLDNQLVAHGSIDIGQTYANKHSLILTADTIGVMPNGCDILVKPKNKADAFQMWHKMSNNVHYVWTAVQGTLLNAQGTPIWQKQILEVTKVEFIKLKELDMQQYWKTGEPLDKAGGYAIQGRAAAWVSRIEGSYSNVVGFPLAEVKKLIEEANNLVVR